MTVHVKRAAFFTIIFLVLSWGTSRLFDRIILHDSLILRTERQFQAFEDPLYYLFCGTSHVKNSINPDIIPNSFNYTYMGENYVQTYYKLKYLLENDPRIQDTRAVFLPFDMTSFSPMTADIFEPTVYWNRFINWIELGKQRGRLIEYALKPIEAGLFSYFKGAQFIHDYALIRKSGSRLPKLLNGFRPRFKSFEDIDDHRADAEYRADKYFHSTEIQNDEMAEHFLKCLELLKQYEKKAVIIQFPVSLEFYEAAHEFIPDNRFESDLLKRAEQITDLTILDYRDLFFNQNDHFENSDHINVKGAEKISKLIHNEIQEMHL